MTEDESTIHTGIIAAAVTRGGGGRGGDETGLGRGGPPGDEVALSSTCSTLAMDGRTN